jgi:putative membrane protein
VWLGAGSARAEGTAAARTSPTDPQIAAIVVTANQVDIDAGKLAKSLSTSPAVREFADRMVTDHSGVNRSATELVQKLHVTPQANATSESLARDGDRNLQRLKALTGSEFDRAYVDHEVAYHQSVLDAMDRTLIPSAKNDELKALLVKVRPAFVAHLEHARHLQSELAAANAHRGPADRARS